MSTIQKNVKSTIDFINTQFLIGEYVISTKLPYLDNEIASIVLTESKLAICISTSELIAQANRSKILGSDLDIVLKSAKCNIRWNFKNYKGFNLLFPINSKLTIQIFPTIYSVEVSRTVEPPFFRMIATSKHEHQHTSMSNFWKCDYLQLPELDLTTTSGISELQVNEHKVQVFSFKYEQTFFIIIESRSKIIKSEFLELSNGILLGFAFANAKLYRNHLLLVSLNEHDGVSPVKYDYLEGEKDCYSSYGFFPTVPFQLEFGVEPQAICYLNKIWFQEIILKIIADNNYKRGIELLVADENIEPKSRSLIYSVALETISNIVYRGNDVSMSLLKEKSLRQNIINHLVVTLDKFIDKLSPEAYSTILSKLKNISNPSNKKKLLFPYDLYGITLTEIEKQIISQRNSLLHGRLPKLDYISNYDILQVNLTLYYCVATLFLKVAGYSGPIIYHPTLHQIYSKKETSDYLVKII
ncbi:MAG: hypothetical protein HQ510_08820 [Candidatus Marinimicrobia bacterium]|nr:hypothetical protein [Candidatus Neomarinimicrobiota bacterium]